MPKSDRVRLQHMLDAALEALAFAEGKRFEDLHRERLLVLGLVKAIEIIGEAASRFQRKRAPQCPSFPGKTSSPCAIGSSTPTSTLTCACSGAPWSMTFLCSWSSCVGLWKPFSISGCSPIAKLKVTMVP
jgi:hypothetical protein